MCFDLTAACSGFLFGLVTSANFLHNSPGTALIIGADAMSRIVDWSDRNSCILFGDGAGAMIVQTGEYGAIVTSTSHYGLLYFIIVIYSYHTISQIQTHPHYCYYLIRYTRVSVR